MISMIWSDMKYVNFLIILFSLVFSLPLHAESESENLSEYFYPYMTFNYIMTPNAKNPCQTKSFQMVKNNVLTEKTEIWQGLYSTKVAETVYSVSIDESGKKIVSNRQIVSNARFGNSKHNDNITLFVLPSDDDVVEWTETVNKEEFKCKARNTYVSFCYDGEKIYRKAIKITKTTPLGNNRYVVNHSFWVKGLSHLVTIGKWGDTDESVILISTLIDMDYGVMEISEAEYNQAKTI